MILVLGGKYQGKLVWVKERYNDPKVKIINDIELKINNLNIKELNEWENEDSSRKVILIGNMVGSSVVPIEKEDRLFRDKVGFFYQELVKKSDEVYRIWNGIEERLK